MQYVCIIFKSHFHTVSDTHPIISPRPGRAFSITRSGRGGGSMRPPGVSKVSVVELREKDQSIAVDEFSRLFFFLYNHLYFFITESRVCVVITKRKKNTQDNTTLLNTLLQT